MNRWSCQIRCISLFDRQAVMGCCLQYNKINAVHVHVIVKNNNKQTNKQKPTTTKQQHRTMENCKKHLMICETQR
jgi:hypothetical protein